MTITAFEEVPPGYQAALVARISDLETLPPNTYGAQPVWETGNGVATVSLNTAGTSYLAGDVLEIVQASASGCKLEVLTVDGSGGVATYALLTPGLGYSVANNLETTTDSTDGANAKFNILTIAERSVIADWTVTKDVVTDGVRAVLTDTVASGYYAAEIESATKAPDDISDLNWA